ncbi:YceI family protein [Fulvivirga lutea]|uniref:YceI family protein n=1 Tax=Fulvivirga lutea TaxID=2810512 RepID=A0A975A2N1_9BACT|nr:YceI family protein [Fulvivirga lutea]QSE98712.1 YceI family protein [Fulvivirga lutea]
MKKIKTSIYILLLIIISVSKILAQNPLIDHNGTATFFSEAPMEDIEAINRKVIGAIDLQKGILAVTMQIKGFHFDKSLMEEHFNENYLESDKYPKASFKGMIKNFSELDFSKQGNFEAQAIGELEIHGVTKPLKTMVQFAISGDKISANTSFDISIADHDIKIPRLVIKNIAEVVEVKASFNFSM